MTELASPLPSQDSSITLEGFIDLNQLADLLGLSVRTLQRMQTRGEIPPKIKLGRRVLFRLESVYQWLAEQEVQPIRSRSYR